jgi:hypothetical protein
MRICISSGQHLHHCPGNPPSIKVTLAVCKITQKFSLRSTLSEVTLDISGIQKRLPLDYYSGTELEDEHQLARQACHGDELITIMHYVIEY